MEPLEMWPQAEREDVQRGLAHSAFPPVVGATWMFGEQTRFWAKTALLLLTTLAVVPIVAWQHEAAAAVYLGFLVFVHIAGMFVFAWGLRKEHIAPSRRGLWVRIGGLLFFVVMLAWIAKGLSSGLSSGIFWASLFGVWAAHTGALLLMHIRTPREAAACPFA